MSWQKREGEELDESGNDGDEDGPVVACVGDDGDDCGGELRLGGDRGEVTWVDLESRQSITFRTMERMSSSMLNVQSKASWRISSEWAEAIRRIWSSWSCSLPSM